MNAATLAAARRSPNTSRIMRRLARLGFWFFLLKGLLWLVAPLLAWQAIG